MDENEKLIQEWQNKVRSSFGSDSQLYTYLFETLDNFYYRYLETTESKNLKTTQLDKTTWGAMSFESSMMEALKSKNPKTHPGVMEMAKTIPRVQNPKIRLSLKVDVHELKQDQGHLTLTSEVHWDFPTFSDSQKRAMEKVEFKYGSFDQFRKMLALKLEEVCTLFT